ncbi:hypothetical protein PUNSTDRAFT_137717 [Punctularia strigosozonata HHB-11173 SS5]|uniref:uncharacterized protein n=1 Tax=Punctularia strigosozonata (strain HHB-11173) TaxID=741275 RepID=UPI000441702E|nr:uncharacterized protein PUNSTDRAFT_137717 [Punctularia strigosozonata HHB-11173 SS5]EIN05615.1 hypothetical protein PUNSTDRAFT_137717 [Punctularia strigosozonata HHB-11173 SS5]
MARGKSQPQGASRSRGKRPSRRARTTVSEASDLSLGKTRSQTRALRAEQSQADSLPSPPSQPGESVARRSVRIADKPLQSLAEEGTPTPDNRRQDRDYDPTGTRFPTRSAAPITPQPQHPHEEDVNATPIGNVDSPDADERCAVCLDKVSPRTIQLCHILPRKFGGSDLLRDMEAAWRYTEGEYNQDTRWAQIYLCCNWHYEFDKGGWSILPSTDFLDDIYAEIDLPRKRENRSSYLDWRSRLQSNQPVPPEYCLIPLRMLIDKRPIFRHSGQSAGEGKAEHLVYDPIMPPYKDVAIDLPMHPFPLIAHFNTAWSMLTLDEKKTVKRLLDPDHRNRIEMAEKIWKAWRKCPRPPANSGAGVGPGGGGGGADNDDGGGSGDGSHEKDTRESSRNSKKSRRKRDTGDDQGNADSRPQPNGSGLNDSMMTTTCPTLADSYLDSSGHNSDISATSSVEPWLDQRGDDSLCIGSKSDESDDNDYNPLPELAPRVWIDIDGWTIQIKEGDEFLRSRGKPPAPPRTSPKWDKELAQYMEERARSPPHDPDWTKWEADTHCKWETALRPTKRRKTVG